MARRRIHEEHANHEAWAIPYGDLITLLLAFFVVMYAISSVNEGKYRVVSASLNAAFHGTPHTPQPIPVGATPTLSDAQLPSSVVSQLMSAGMPATAVLPLPLARGTARDGTSPGTAGPRPAESPTAAPAAQRALAPPPLAPEAPAARDDTTLTQVAADVTTAMQSLIASGQVKVHNFGDSVTVDISADVLFASGVAQLSPAALKALQSLAESLKPWPNALRVEGHTDDRPINTATFPSNWELSAARAASVVHLFMDLGLKPERLAVTGLGQYRPLMTNTTAAGRNANRRVVVVILGREAPTPEQQ